MSLFQLVMTRETAWLTMNLLGSLSQVHLLPPADRPLLGPFSFQVKRLQNIIDKLALLRTAVEAAGEQFQALEGPGAKSRLEYLLQEWAGESRIGKKNWVTELEELEEKVDSSYQSHQKLQSREAELLKRMQENRARILLFRAAQRLLGDGFLNRQERYGLDFSRLGQNNRLQGHLNVDYLAMIIRKQDAQRLERLVFRISRGNALVQLLDCDKLDNHEGFEQRTACFVVFQLGEVRAVEDKLKRASANFAEFQFELPSSAQQFQKRIAVLELELAESKHLVGLLSREASEFLGTLARSQRSVPISLLEEWRVYAVKQKAIYESLNDFTVVNDFIHGKVWVPTYRAEVIRRALGGVLAGDVPQTIFQEVIHHDLSPPTFFRSNQFLNPAQQIVDTYGVPRYKEANPALFTSVTFPFLFGVMFGDISLGFLLLLGGLALVFLAGPLSKTPFHIMHEYRYLIALMGFFAFYCGWIYNDFICLSFNVFGSCFQVPQFPEEGGQVLPPKDDCVYPLGLDPVWSRASNQLNFVNSLKMKLSVLIGVSHMLLGIFLKGANALRFGQWLDLFFEFVPQVVFMVVMFGYMDFLIVFKWLKPWTPESAEFAPSIITTMINIPLKLGHTTEGSGGEPLWGDSYETTSQNTVQLAFLLVALFCVPLMLLPKPLIIKCQSRGHTGYEPASTQEVALIPEGEHGTEGKGKAGEHDELFVHQVIETIEFVLGSISNTASYLRLWALSLAHEELSKVFFEKTIQGPIGDGYRGIFGMVLGYLVYSNITFGVLFCMDTMECFLHSLRLHWVQFQSKFYKGDGTKFVPFSFPAILLPAA